MLTSITGIAKYLSAICFVLLIFGLIGFGVLRTCRVNRNYSRNETLLISPSVGMAVVIIISTTTAHHQIGISTTFTWTTLALLSVLAIPELRVSFSTDISIKEWCVNGFHFTSRIVGICLLAMLPYLYLMTLRNFPIGMGTSVTWTNNDLGAYIQMATNVAKAGIRDAGLVTGWNAGYQASFDHPGAHPLFAFVARILSREPYQVGIVLISVVVATISLSLIVVLARLKPKNSQNLNVGVVLVAIFNPPILAAVANFFYPQLLSISLSFAFFALVLVMMQSDQTPVKLASLPLSILVVSVVLTSIEVAFLLVPIFLLAALYMCGVKKNLRRSLEFCYLIITVLIVFAISERQLLTSQLEVLTKLSASGVAGWKTNFVSPGMVLGLMPNAFGGSLTSTQKLIDWFLFAGFAYAVMVAWKHKQLHVRAFVLFSVFFCLVLLGIVRWGSDGYQTWKFITTVTPISFVLLIAMFAGARTRKGNSLIESFAFLVIGCSLVWTSMVWKDAQPTSYINRDLAQIARTLEARQQAGINILLAPYFETMAASVMTGSPAHLASPSYYFFNGQPLLYRCTLTTQEQLPGIKNRGPVVAQRGDYVLVGTPECDAVVPSK